jgi:hypothetical protein
VFFLDVISGWMRILGTWIVNMWGLTVVGWWSVGEWNE